MAGFTGQTKTMENIPGDVAGVRGDFAQWLTSQGFGGLGTGAPDITPYQDMFRQQNALNFAQAKESAGNLTGSGFANQLGRTAARSNVEQSAFLADLLERSKQQNASRFASVLMPFLTTGVGAPTQAYQPGFLDYATGAGATIAGAAGAAGGFGKLFNGAPAGSYGGGGSAWDFNNPANRG